MTKWVALAPSVTFTERVPSTATCVLTARFWLAPVQLMLLVAGGVASAAVYIFKNPPLEAVPLVSVTVKVTIAPVAPGGTARTLAPVASLPVARLMVRVSLRLIFGPALSRESYARNGWVNR